MTEKDYNPNQKERKAMESPKAKGKQVVNAPVKKQEEKQIQKEEKTEKQNKDKILDKPKKTEAVVTGRNLPLSTKTATAVCKFIRGKDIQKAIVELEQVLVHKNVIPMKGEIPHQKGKGISSGGYPKKASEYLINLLKSLQSNANVNGLEKPIVAKAMANLASRPYGKFGRVRKKRTHVQLVATEKGKKEKRK